MRKLILALLLTGSMTATAIADELRLQDNPPDRYTVVKGDTLWDISGRFLKEPWRWPEIWGMNRDAIKDPHWIYPGDVIVLDRSGKSPRLRLMRNQKYNPRGLEVVKLSPKVRVEDTTKGAVPSISPAAIEPFLSQPLVVEEKALNTAPQIVAAREQRVVLGRGDTAYVTGLDAKDGEFWQIYRPGRPLVDPETKKVLGYEAVYLGDARVTAFDKTSTIQITKSAQEITSGDRLIPASKETFITYVPHAPEQSIKGSVMSMYGGVSEVGANSIITINRGASDGLERGHVVALYRHGDTVKALKDDGLRNDKEFVKLPDERYGLAFVFRTFNHVSYALVTQASRPVQLSDKVLNP